MGHIEINPKQNWALGPEATLITGEENEAIQIDTDAIPREIPWNNDDLEDETEVNGAAGGVPVLQKNSSNQDDQEGLLESEDESSEDETVKLLIEEKEARTLRERYSWEEMSQKKSRDLINRVKEAARGNKINDNITDCVEEACDNALKGMDKAFIAGVLKTPTGKDREDSKEYAKKKTHKRRMEAAFAALSHLNEAKRKIKILEEE